MDTQNDAIFERRYIKKTIILGIYVRFRGGYFFSKISMEPFRRLLSLQGGETWWLRWMLNPGLAVNNFCVSITNSRSFATFQIYSSHFPLFPWIYGRKRRKPQFKAAKTSQFKPKNLTLNWDGKTWKTWPICQRLGLVKYRGDISVTAWITCLWFV